LTTDAGINTAYKQGKGHPLTQADIEAGLSRLGLKRGQVVEVHSSLSSFGPVDGGPATVVDALMNAVGEEGALVMSAYPVSKPLPLSEEEKAWGILAKVRTYDEDYRGPSGMGVIADEFCRRPGAVLGPNWHRSCAWGRQAEQLSQGYHVLLEMDGRVLLLGVDLRRCSSMHQAEKSPLPPEIARYFEIPAEIRSKYSDDYYLAYGQTPNDAWLKIQTTAERQGLIKIGQIGRAECRFFKARPVVGLYAEARRTDPWDLYGVKKYNG
jgi:aminoglycoside N3'-acetyltransferase